MVDISELSGNFSDKNYGFNTPSSRSKFRSGNALPITKATSSLEIGDGDDEISRDHNVSTQPGTD